MSEYPNTFLKEVWRTKHIIIICCIPLQVIQVKIHIIQFRFITCHHGKGVNPIRFFIVVDSQTWNEYDYYLLFISPGLFYSLNIVILSLLSTVWLIEVVYIWKTWPDRQSLPSASEHPEHTSHGNQGSGSSRRCWNPMIWPRKKNTPAAAMIVFRLPKCGNLWWGDNSFCGVAPVQTSRTYFYQRGIQKWLRFFLVSEILALGPRSLGSL